MSLCKFLPDSYCTHIHYRIPCNQARGADLFFLNALLLKKTLFLFKLKCFITFLIHYSLKQYNSIVHFRIHSASLYLVLIHFFFRMLAIVHKPHFEIRSHTYVTASQTVTKSLIFYMLRTLVRTAGYIAHVYVTLYLLFPLVPMGRMCGTRCPHWFSIWTFGIQVTSPENKAEHRCVGNLTDDLSRSVF